MWSGPRNISTALMYSFHNRSDCFVSDEPLYANFLKSSGVRHPGYEQIIEYYETDLEVLLASLTGPIPNDKRIWYQKHMCHHVGKASDLSWLRSLKNCFLIRDPAEVISSLSRITDSINLHMTGLPQQMTILNYVEMNCQGKNPIVDSRDILESPREMLQSLCENIDIPFSEDMLSWKRGPKDCDGIWAKHWYSSVWQSSGFIPYEKRDMHLSEEHQKVLSEATPIYNELRRNRLIV
tara:strand:+ start:144 stop:854 length:711 start_codon:yes stop_codon:yes gene_type:complete